jgi:hypothetical protein
LLAVASVTGGIRSRRKGATFERVIADYLRASGFPSAERHLIGSGQGDIAGIPGLVLEIKNCATFTPAAWFTQLYAAMDRAGASMGAVVHKRRGKTHPGLQFVTMDLESFVYLLERASLLAMGEGGHPVHQYGERVLGPSGPLETDPLAPSLPGCPRPIPPEEPADEPERP